MALPSATSPAGTRSPPLENHAPDDASISTLVSGQSAFPAEDPMVETTLRFEFKPKDQAAAAKTAFLHTQLLAHLQSNFEEDIKIYDNKGTVLPQIDTVEWHSSTVHQRHFKIHVIPGTERRITKHFIQHRIRTTQSLSTLRNHHAISTLLKKHNAYFRQHQWNETIYDTIQLGHIIGLNPQHYDNTQAIAIVQQSIQKTTSAQIPPIRMIYSSPSIRHSDKDYRTKAYSIETERKNVPAVLKLLKSAYQITDTTTSQDHRFLIAKLRYSHPESYVNAIKMQTQLLTNTYVIPLLYVTPEALFYMEDQIRKIRGVIDLVPTRRSTVTGRYNILVQKRHFEEVQDFLVTQIDILYADVPSDALIPPGRFQTPHILWPKMSRRCRISKALHNTGNHTDPVLPEILAHSQPIRHPSPNRSLLGSVRPRYRKVVPSGRNHPVSTHGGQMAPITENIP